MFGKKKHKVLVLGAGQIGLPVAQILASSKDYEVHLADCNPNVPNIAGTKITYHFIKVQDQLDGLIDELDGVEALLSCLPFALNKHVAEVALENDLSYFDLTEDVNTTEYIESLAQHTLGAFVPQCGLAPGYVSMVAKHVMDKFDSVDTVKMRVGALPTNPTNKLKYNLTWSTNGLINECVNPCKAIVDGKQVMLPPLEGLETVTLDGMEYECFTTSGGIGSMIDSVSKTVKTMNYKTMRYPGHCELFKFLMFDMKMNEKREMFAEILDDALPKTDRDVVIVHVSVEGMINDVLSERSYSIKNYGLTGEILPDLTAIQLTTAAGLCGVVDIVLNEPQKYSGFVKVENIPLDSFHKNQFGQLYTGQRKNQTPV